MLLIGTVGAETPPQMPKTAPNGPFVFIECMSRLWIHLNYRIELRIWSSVLEVLNGGTFFQRSTGHHYRSGTSELQHVYQMWCGRVRYSALAVRNPNSALNPSKLCGCMRDQFQANVVDNLEAAICMHFEFDRSRSPSCWLKMQSESPTLWQTFWTECKLKHPI